LGAILCAILTGKRPVDAADAINLIVLTMKGKLTLPQQYNPKVPGELNAIAKRALQLDPSKRPSALEFVAYLRAYLSGTDLSQYSYSFKERVARTVARHPTATLGLLLGLIIIAVTVFMAQRVEQSRAIQESTERRREALERVKNGMDKAFAFLERGEALGKRGRLGEMDSVLVKSMNAYQSRFLLWKIAELYKRHQLFSRAESVLETAVEAYENPNKELFLLHIITLETDGRIPGTMTNALSRLRAMARKDGHENEFTYFFKGKELGKKKLFHEAIEFYSKAIEYNSTFSMGYNARGLAWFALGQFKKSIADFNRAIQLDPYFDFAYANRGRCHVELSNSKEALTDFNEAIRLNPKHAMAYNNKGVLFSGEKQYKEALPLFSLALKIEPMLVEARVSRAICYYKLKEFSKALKECTAVLKLRPKSIKMYSIRAKTCIQLKKYERAVQDFSSAINLNPKRADLYFNRGLLYIGRKQYRSAVDDWKMVLKLDSSFPKAEIMRERIKAMELKLKDSD
jgi:tetratricopeptide (TPR) repeat protein